MEICNSLSEHIVNDVEISNKYDGTKERAIRKWVNENSTRFCRRYLYDIDPFMNCEDDEIFSENLMNLCKHFNTNVFTKEALELICSKENQNCSNECVPCEKTHYFSAMYNIGLLGVIYESDGEPNKYRCSIKNIGESIYDCKKQTLRPGMLYYLHPGMSNIIKQEAERNMKRFTPSKLLIPNNLGVVDNSVVKQIRHFAISQLGNQYENSVFIASTHRNLEDVRCDIKKMLESNGYKVYIFEAPDFPIEINRVENQKGQTHDHCINIMLENCRHLIYIYGNTFGGSYSGQDYKEYHQK